MTAQHLSKKLVSWASILEPATRAQAELTATLLAEYGG